MSFPPFRRVGPLSDFEEARLQELQRRAGQTPSAQVIEIGERARQARIQARYDAFDRETSAIVEALAPRRIARSEGWSGHTKVAGIHVSARDLRAHLETGVDRLRCLVEGWISRDEESEQGYDPERCCDHFSDANLRAIKVLLEESAEQFAKSRRK